MQHKTSYLKRLLAIYIAFFALLAGSFLFEIMPTFERGLSSGMELGEEMSEALNDEDPRQIYMLWNIPIRCSKPIAIATEGEELITGHLSTLTFEVSRPLAEGSAVHIAFSASGNSPLIYALMIFSALCFPAIIVLMFLIIRSVRRSIREEEPLAKNNTWLLRGIALLTICSELLSQTAQWLMARQAAKVLVQYPYTVDTSFNLNYGVLIVALLLLFSAEVFTIGRDLGEEQKLTI